MSAARPAVQNRKVGRPAIQIDKDAITALFEMPQPEAARRLGVSLSGLKKVCRKHDILQWPYKRNHHGFTEVPSCGGNDPRQLHQESDGDLRRHSYVDVDSEAAHKMGGSDGIGTESYDEVGLGSRTHPSGIHVATMGCSTQESTVPAMWFNSQSDASCSVQMDHLGSLPFNDAAADYGQQWFQQQSQKSGMPRHNTHRGRSENDCPTPDVCAEGSAQAADHGMEMDGQQHRRDNIFCSARVDHTQAEASVELLCQNFVSSEPSGHAACRMGLPQPLYQPPPTRCDFADPRNQSFHAQPSSWSDRLQFLLSVPPTTDLTQDRGFIETVEAQASDAYLEQCATDATACLGALFPPK